ncbi:protein Abitram-like [Symsagittifera roscoffensis]|uniref:protein Abitram-like n=1 Tax=Symsagittifera roscoffensis TaxID=84072 RepID=UPI00307BA1CB
MEVSEGTNNKRSTVCDNDIDQNRFSLPSVTSDVTSSGKLSEHIDFIDRYFTHYFCDKTKLLFLQHTNALICVVTLSDEHPVLKACKDTVRNADCAVKVSYQLSNGIDRSNPKVSGKGKKGAKVVGKDELLCEVTIGETLHPIMCSLSGSVIEVNEKLVENPELLWTDPRGRGYIAVLMLKRPRHGKSFLESTFKNMQLVHKSPEEISEEAEIEITISDNSTSQETSSNRTGTVTPLE